MNPSKVLLITLIGPYGAVDVAVRADLPAADLLPAFNELVGTQRGSQPAPERPPSTPGSGGQAGHPGRHAQPDGNQLAKTPVDPAGPPIPPRRQAPEQEPAMWFAASPEWSRGKQPQQPPGPTSQQPASQPRSQPGQNVALEGTLADAGIVDGMVLQLYRPGPTMGGHR